MKGKSTNKFFYEFLDNRKMIGVGFPDTHCTGFVIENENGRKQLNQKQIVHEKTINDRVVAAPIFELNGKYYAEIIITKEVIVELELIPQSIPDKYPPPFAIDTKAITRTGRD